MTLRIITSRGELSAIKFNQFLHSIHVTPVLTESVRIAITGSWGPARGAGFSPISVEERTLRLINEPLGYAFDRAIENCTTFSFSLPGELPAIVNRAVHHMYREGRTPTRLVVLENSLYIVDLEGVSLYCQRGSIRQAVYVQNNCVVRVSLPYSLDQAQEP
jgi:hypothetical protein